MISNSFFKTAAPTFMCLLIILLSTVPNNRFFFIPMVFIPIFYFAVFNPRILNALSVFGLGIFADLMTQTPFGIFSFLFVLLFFVSRLNRLFFKELSFKKLWILFIGCAAILLLLQLFLFTLCTSDIVKTGFLPLQFTALILLYPLGIKVCDILNSWIGENNEFMDI